ncbi:hypothetical protein ANCDUO_15898 [Ancylostoma duodenale]|uniref:GST N-terminal domain-containing protein n=1 Tax=Ancylostoma duodenale TaxID=51022 RepID=A0A0C2CVR1_9BILA|nr:hypothetical protein ANCDUO_15898 [Ancylostoma duodenale]
MSRSEYGLLPFIELNGEHIADSQIIINRLIEHFSVKPLSSPRDEAVARAVDRMADTHTFLVQYQFKLVENTEEFMSLILRDMGCPPALVPILTPVASFFMRGKADCTVFGQLATTLYIPTGSHAKDVLKDQYPALVEYCNRVRDTVFGKDFTSE